MRLRSLAVGGATVALVVAAGLAACGGSEETLTNAGPATGTTTESVTVIVDDPEEPEDPETPEDPDDADAPDDPDDGGCPADGSGDCSFIIHCPEADYEYRIPGMAAASATIVRATPAVAPDSDAPARNVDDVVDVTVEVQAGEVELTTLCADGITPAASTQPLEATGG